MNHGTFFKHVESTLWEIVFHLFSEKEPLELFGGGGGFRSKIEVFSKYFGIQYQITYSLSKAKYKRIYYFEQNIHTVKMSM